MSSGCSYALASAIRETVATAADQAYWEQKDRAAVAALKGVMAAAAFRQHLIAQLGADMEDLLLGKVCFDDQRASLRFSFAGRTLRLVLEGQITGYLVLEVEGAPESWEPTRLVGGRRAFLLKLHEFDDAWRRQPEEPAADTMKGA